MKKALSLVVLLMSFNSYALTCFSEDNPGKELELSKVAGKKVSAQLGEKVITDIFVGTEVLNFLNYKNYKLYNQEGKQFDFELKLNLQVEHCRARFCPGPVPKQDPIGKLSSAETGDEYFNCL